MPTPTLPLEKVSDAQSIIVVGKWFAVNRDLVEGEHFGKNGEYWTGPLPQRREGDTESTAPVTRVRKSFNSVNKIAEVLEREVAGVIGREPVWSFSRIRQHRTNTAPEREGREITSDDDYITDANALLRDWWDANDIHTQLQAFTELLRWGGRATIRIYIATEIFAPEVEDEESDLPEGRVEVPPLTIEDALRAIQIEVLDAEKAATVKDKRTMRSHAAYVYKIDDHVEAEVCFVDRDTGRTVVRILSENEEDQAEPLEMDFDLRGRLMMFSVEMKPLITQQIREQQMFLNKVNTMMSMNLDFAGFRQRDFLNAQPPGEYRKDPSNPQKEELVVGQLFEGPRVVNFIPGVPYTEADGTTKYATPSVHVTEPIDVTTFEKSAAHAYKNILEEAHQKHALITGDAVTTGEARRQALADFVIYLMLVKSQLDKVGRWLFFTVWALANDLAAKPLPEDLRVTFKCRLDPGPVTIEELRELPNLVVKGLMSRLTMMARVQIDDIDEEMDQIGREPYSKLYFATEVGKAIQAFSAANLNAVESLVFSGVDRDSADKLAQGGFVNPDNVDPLIEQ